MRCLSPWATTSSSQSITASNWSSFQISQPRLPSSGFCSTKRRPVSLRLFSMLPRQRPRRIFADAACYSHTDAVEGTIGAGSQRLSQHRIQMVSQKRDAQLSGHDVKGVLGKAVLLSQGREGGIALLLLASGDGASRLPRRIGAHLSQAAVSFREHRVIELPPDFQVGTQTFRLPCVDDQGQFEEQRGRFLFEMLALLVVLCAHLPLTCVRTFFPIIAGSPLSVKWLIVASNVIPSPAPHKERRFIQRINHGGFRARLAVTLGGSIIPCELRRRHQMQPDHLS